MRRASKLVLTLVTAVSLLGLTPVAAAAEPSPDAKLEEAKQQAATRAGESVCASSGLARLTPKSWRQRCVKLVADGLMNNGTTQVEVVCAGVVPIPGANAACRKVAEGLVAKAVKDYNRSMAAIEAGAKTAKFVADPTTSLDEFANKLKEGAVDLLQQVLPELSKVSSANTGASWYRDTYAKAAGIGLLVLVIMLLMTTMQAARNKVDSDELFHSIFARGPLAVLMIVFGPALGTLLIGLTNSFTNGIVGAFAPDMGAFIARLGVFSKITVEIPGGTIVGIVLFLLLLAAGITLFFGLLLQSLAVYLVGVTCAIAFGMWVNPAWRRKALRIPVTWVGFVLAKPLLFLMLGVAFAVANGLTQQGLGEGLQQLATAGFAALAMLVVGLAPFTLLKYAPLLPDGSETAGPTGGSRSIAGAALAGAGGAMTTIAMNRARTNSANDRQRTTSGPGRGSQNTGQNPGPQVPPGLDRSQKPGQQPGQQQGQQPTGQGTGVDPSKATTPASPTPPNGGPPSQPGQQSPGGPGGGHGQQPARPGRGPSKAGGTVGPLIAAQIAQQASQAAVNKARTTAETAAPQINTPPVEDQ